MDVLPFQSISASNRELKNNASRIGAKRLKADSNGLPFANALHCIYNRIALREL